MTLPTKRIMSVAIIAAVALLIPSAGCDVLSGEFCDVDADCPTAQVCGGAGVCVDGAPDPEDAGGPEPADAGGLQEDAGFRNDAGQNPDAGILDGGDLDGGGEGDAGRPSDAGVENDAGFDAGEPTDAGPLPADGGPSLVITSVNGGGAETAPSETPAVTNPVLTTRRIEDSIFVQGAGFLFVDSATLTSLSPDQEFVLTIAPGATDGEIELTLPSNVSPGLMTLALVASTLSTEVSAQVFVLQGEPAPPTATTSVAATLADCPTGGQTVTIGPDTDNDGTPDSGETVTVCNGSVGPSGDPGNLSCVGVDCTISANLDVTGALTVASVAVLRGISTDEVRNVASVSELEAELEALNAVRIAPNAIVTIQMADGTYVPTEPVVVEHPDGEQIEIVGNTATPLNVLWRCVGTCFEVRSATLNINGLRVEGFNANTGIGFSAIQAGIIEIGDAVELSSLDTGVVVAEGGTLDALNLVVTDSINGLFINGAGVIQAPAATFTDVRFPVIALGGTAQVSGSNISATAFLLEGVGLQALEGGVILARETVVTNYHVSMRTDTNGFLDVQDAIVNGQCSIGVSATRMGTILADGVSVNGCTIVGIRAVLFGFVRAAGATFSANTADTGFDTTSLVQE